MRLKMYLSLLLVLSTIFYTIAQERQKATFGSPTSEELTMKTYPTDPEAAGVVLFEKGKVYVKLVDNKIRT